MLPMIYLQSLLFALHTYFATSSSLNTWYTVSDVTLPLPLYGHSIGIYNNKIHIIGGDNQENLPSFSTTTYHKTIYDYTVTNYSTINLNHYDEWQSIAFDALDSNTFDPRYPFGFKCIGQCYTTHNELLFIINPQYIFDETGHLIIYNMNTSSFVDPFPFNNTLYNKESGICATNNGSHIFAIGSKCHNCSVAHSDIQSFEITSNGPWFISGYMNIGRYYSGCNVYNDYLYIFGGYLNHKMTDTDDISGDITDSIEICHLNDEIICNITTTHLYIPRAQHQVIVNKDGLMFIIGGIDSLGAMIESVEIFDVTHNVMMDNEWFTYITNGRNAFGAFYDDKWDIIYIIGGIDNTETSVDNMLYYPICELLSNCYTNDITLECGDDIYEYINGSHDLYSYYFFITSMDDILSIEFSNCESNMDTYVYLFLWNETLNEWHKGYLDEWHWDDSGDCKGHQQETFIINDPQNGYYHLVISAHKSGNYSAIFKCIFKSTMEPTLEPTYYPSFDPTINPTIDPTENPTINPTTLSPTVIPLQTMTTASVIASESTNTVIHSDYDRIWFILSFICSTQRDLSIIHWESLILNGLLNAFKPDLRFIVRTEVDGTIDLLSSKEEAMNKINRRLLTEAKIYYFDIESNITIDKSYLKDGDLSFLCESTFSYHFAEGLGESIYHIQIYKLAECDDDLLIKTWNIDLNGGINDYNKLFISILPILILFGIQIMIILMAVFVEKVRVFDNLNMNRLLLFVIYVINIYCDIFVAVDVCYSYSLYDPLLIGAAIVCISIILITTTKNAYDLYLFIRHWQSDDVHGPMIKTWFNTYSIFVYLLSFLLCSTHAVIEIINSNLFGLSVFSMGLSPNLRLRFSKQRLWVLLLRNIPQIIMQTVLMYHSYWSEYGILALLTSIVSILSYIYAFCTAFEYNSVDSKCFVFSLRISSVSIVRRANSFRNKCDILRRYLFKTFELNEKEERLDLLTSIQYFDTDIGGLTLYMMITTKMDKNIEYFLKEFHDLMKSNALSKHIQMLWHLPLDEEINIYRIKGTEYTLNTMEMTLMPSKNLNHSRLHRHIEVNSMNVGSNYNHNNSSDSVGANNSSDSEDNTLKRNIKHRHDFVALNTKDDIDVFEDDDDDKELNVPSIHEQYEYGLVNSPTH